MILWKTALSTRKGPGPPICSAPSDPHPPLFWAGSNSKGIPRQKARGPGVPVRLSAHSMGLFPHTCRGGLGW